MMNLDLMYNTLKCKEKTFEKEYCFKLSQDIIVSDNKPDILEILHKTGDICIDRYEYVNQKLRLDGIFKLETIYMANNETNEIRGLESEIEINQSFDIDVNMSEGNVQVMCNTKSLDVVVVNERKVQVIVEACCKVFYQEKAEINLIENVRGNNEVQVLSKEIELSALKGYEEQRVSLNEEVSMDSNNILEVLETDVRIINEEYKVSYNKILAKADAMINILYTTRDKEIFTKEIVLPITGFIDMPNVNEKDNIDVMYNIKNKNICINNESINSQDNAKAIINMEVDIKVNCSENMNINVIQDMYSIKNNICFDNKTCKNTVKKLCDCVKYEIKEDICLDEYEASVCKINCKIIKNDAHKLNDKIHIEGELGLELLCKNAGRIFVKTYTIPYEHLYDNPDIKNISDVDVTVIIQNLKNICVDNKVSVVIEMCFKIVGYCVVELNVIENIREGEPRTICPYSITIYYVKKGDTLWKIAKEFNTTVDEILKYNEQISKEDYMIQEGMQLFIPKKILSKIV